MDEDVVVFRTLGLVAAVLVNFGTGKKPKDITAQAAKYTAWLERGNDGGKEG